MPVQTRIVSNSGDNNDCTVRALANAINMPYAEAHQLLKVAGRRDGMGAILYQYSPVYERFSEKREDFYGNFYGNKNNPTLKRFIDHHSVGRYIVKIPGHVFALVNGVIMDSFKNGSRSRVQSCWKIKPEFVRKPEVRPLTKPKTAKEILAELRDRSKPVKSVRIKPVAICIGAPSD